KRSLFTAFNFSGRFKVAMTVPPSRLTKRSLDAIDLPPFAPNALEPTIHTQTLFRRFVERRLDRFPVDAGQSAFTPEGVSQILGRDVAGRAFGIRATTDAAGRAVKTSDPMP